MDNFYYGKIKKERFLCVLFVLYKVTLTFCTRRLNLWLSHWNFKTVTDESELWVLEPVSHANICNFLSFEATGQPYLNERPKITQDVRKLSKTIYIVIEATILAMHGKKIVKFGRFTQGDDHYWKLKSRFTFEVILEWRQKVPYYRNTPWLPQQPLSLWPAHVADVSVMRRQTKQPENKIQQLFLSQFLCDLNFAGSPHRSKGGPRIDPPNGPGAIWRNTDVTPRRPTVRQRELPCGTIYCSSLGRYYFWLWGRKPTVSQGSSYTWIYG